MKIGQHNLKLRRNEVFNNIDLETPFFITDLNSNLIEVDDEFFKTLGYTKEEIINKPLDNIGTFMQIDSNDRSDCKEEIPTYKLVAKTKQGELLDIEIDMEPFIKNGKISGGINYIKNISKKQKISEKVPITLQTTSHGLEFLKSFEKVMSKAEEFKQIKEELEDTFMDLEFHRDELQNISKKYIESQVALEESNYEIRKLQNELKRLQKRVESREEEVYKLQQDINKNKNNEIKQWKFKDDILKYEPIQKINELRIKKEDLLAREKELKELQQKLKNNLNNKPSYNQSIKQPYDEVINKSEKDDFFSHKDISISQKVNEINDELKMGEMALNWFKDELEKIKKQEKEIDEKLIEKDNQIYELNKKLKEKQENINAINIELDIRKRVINDIKNTETIDHGKLKQLNEENFYLREELDRLNDDHNELKLAIDKLLYETPFEKTIMKNIYE